MFKRICYLAASVGVFHAVIYAAATLPLDGVVRTPEAPTISARMPDRVGMVAKLTPMHRNIDREAWRKMSPEQRQRREAEVKAYWDEFESSGRADRVRAIMRNSPGQKKIEQFHADFRRIEQERQRREQSDGRG